jgi:hypothetical protein
MTNFYFAADGNWGGADDLTIVDAARLDEHFLDYVDVVGEYDRAEWAAWFEQNNHELKDGGDGECLYCDNFEDGSLADIDEYLAEIDGEEEE